MANDERLKAADQAMGDSQALAEQKQGYAEAMENYRTLLSCPPCRAAQFLERTDPGLLGYTGGYRLAAHEVRCLWPHECQDGQEDKDHE